MPSNRPSAILHKALNNIINLVLVELGMPQLEIQHALDLLIRHRDRARNEFVQLDVRTEWRVRDGRGGVLDELGPGGVMLCVDMLDCLAEIVL